MTEKPPNLETENMIPSLEEFRAHYPTNIEGWFFAGLKKSTAEHSREKRIKEGKYDPEHNSFDQTLERFHRFKTEHPEVVQRVREAVKKLDELTHDNSLSKEITRNKAEEHTQAELIPALYEAYKLMRSYGITDEDMGY
ncbi:MAG: hypothetical protein ABII13_04680 [Patescibacteria group bacterium]